MYFSLIRVFFLITYFKFQFLIINYLVNSKLNIIFFYLYMYLVINYLFQYNIYKYMIIIKKKSKNKEPTKNKIFYF
jgi:hypothetical protein